MFHLSQSQRSLHFRGDDLHAVINNSTSTATITTFLFDITESWFLIHASTNRCYCSTSSSLQHRWLFLVEDLHLPCWSKTTIRPCLQRRTSTVHNSLHSLQLPLTASSHRIFVRWGFQWFKTFPAILFDSEPVKLPWTLSIIKLSLALTKDADLSITTCK